MKITNISPEHLEAVQSYVQQMIKTAASQNEAAIQLGLSSAQIGYYRDGNWDKISNRAFNEMLAKSGASTWPTVQTRNLSQVFALAIAAQTQHKMLGLSGYTGAGKTHALRKYVAKQSGAYYVLVDAEQSRSRFLNDVCQALGIPESERGYIPSTMLDAVVAKLRTVTNPLLILDDCGAAKDEIFRIIQIIYDRTEHVCGILLAGTEYLPEVLTRKARRNTKKFRELKRRIAWWETLEEMSRDDLQRVAIAAGNVEDQKAISYLKRSVSDYGTLRHMLEGAQAIARQKGIEVSAELLVNMNRGREWHRA